MRCDAFERWLDGGMPAHEEKDALRHASDCGRCGALLRAQRAVDALLSAPAPPLPDRGRFADQVMSRIRTQEAPGRAWQPAVTLPWWVRAASDPAAVLALALMALLFWRPDAFSTFAGFLNSAPGGALGRILTRASSLGLDRPEVARGLWLLGAFAIGWASLQLYRWTERLARL